MKTPGYMSYNKYKKEKENKSQKMWVIFISTFFGMLLIFTLLAMHLSPNVDIAIGDDPEVDAKETGLGVKGFIDDRLKMIQMEDNTSNASKKAPEKSMKNENDTDFAEEEIPDDEEKVEIPRYITDKTGNPTTQANTKKPTANVTPMTQPTSKVVVGYYTTLEQAKVAQGILIDAGLGVSPYIKNLGNAYTLQIGSYSSRNKADSVVAELLRNNFPARVIQE